MKTKLLLLLAFALMGWNNVWADTYYTTADSDGNSFQFESTDGTTATITWVTLGASATSLTIPTTVWSNVSPYPSFTVTAVGTASATWAINNSATTITSLTIEEGVKTINSQAFKSFSGLQSVELPASLTTIADYAFYGCSALTSITSYSSAITVGNSSFQIDGSTYYPASCVLKVPDGCTANYAAYSLDNSKDWCAWDYFYGSNNIHELTYPSITTAGWGTYYNDYAYTMPEGVEGYLINWTYGDKANLVKVYEAGDEVYPGLALIWKSTTDLAEEKWFTVEALSSGGATATWPVDGESKAYTTILNGSQTGGTTTYWGTESSDYYYYKLAKDDTYGLGWYWGAAEGAAFESGAHKAWMFVAKTPSAREFISMFDDGETTAIADVRGKKEDARSDYFNLKGQRVVNPTKGLYIVNGKKVFIK